MLAKKGAFKRLFLCTGIWEGTIPRKESVESSLEQRPRATQEQLPRWRCNERPKLKQKTKRVIQIGLIAFTVILSSISSSFATSNCPSTQFDETSTVRYIHDGDTLHLTDGRKIRLIGINTPELARDGRPAEPFAIESKDALRSLFKKDKSISLVFGKDKKDRYGRFLAHAFLADGSNAQAALLQQGLASVITIPPNTRFASCYLEVERSARCHKTGLWKNIGFLEAKALKRQHTGFHLIKGTVRSIKIDNKGIWLNLDDKLTVGIRPEHQKLFDLEAINNMQNQTIIVRGWLNKSKKSNPFYLRVRDPLSIQRSSSYSCE